MEPAGASDMDGQAERPSVREHASQSLFQDGIDKPLQAV
jgi:hypothetical protein